MEGRVGTNPSSVFFLRHIEIAGRLIIEKDEGKLTGFAGIMPGKTDDAYIHGPFTDGKDARALLQKAESTARSMGAKTAWTVTPSSDEKRIETLSDAGYRITEKAQGLYGKEDLLHLTKDLTPSA